MCYILDREVVAEKDVLYAELTDKDFGSPSPPPPPPPYEQLDIALALLVIVIFSLQIYLILLKVYFRMPCFFKSFLVFYTVLVLLCCVCGDIN